ncbi:hypothetical protein AC578_3365 [Pseudocercospora eumusae]|uniref:Uncharacterized protein n=1 Tax=Pseudocercospora eumusae TaxID=321146 RepID=A0A139HD48_9PEZI|nr:hypothetical protein AC578_3365 [Pseudocercospora eumusae]
MSDQNPKPIQYPGDDLIPDAQMVYDQKRTIKASAAEIFPWLRQLGKGRGGWYLPEKFEKVLPSSWRASRVIEERWQGMTEGDKVPDYGFSKHDYFIVKKVEPNSSIVFQSQRYGCVFTWALLLHELNAGASSDPEPSTVVHLRFRGRIQATGWKQKALVKGGEVLDTAAATPLLLGIADRCEKKVEKTAGSKLEKAEKRHSHSE